MVNSGDYYKFLSHDEKSMPTFHSATIAIIIDIMRTKARYFLFASLFNSIFDFSFSPPAVCLEIPLIIYLCLSLSIVVHSLFIQCCYRLSLHYRRGPTATV